MSCFSDRGLEPGGVSDRIFRHKPAIAPTTDAKSIWIGDLLLNKIIHAVHQVLKSHSSPVRYRGVHLSTLAVHASRVRKENYVSMRRQELAPCPPFSMEADPPGCIARMRINNCWIKSVGFVTRRRDDYTSPGQSVLRVFPLYFAHFSQPPRLCLRIKVGNPARRHIFGPHPNIARRFQCLGVTHNCLSVLAEAVFPYGPDKSSEFAHCSVSAINP